MQFERIHIPTGSRQTGRFDRVDHWAFAQDCQSNKRSQLIAAKCLVNRWNRKKPDTWRYRLL